MSQASALPRKPSQRRRESEFTPKLFTRLREGYSLADLRADALAGLTVAIVALPLSMAIAIASGVGPERGLYTTIIGGFLVSALGGSRHQVGGPAGAFIVLVTSCVMAIGIEGLILATFLSGFVLMAAGLLRLGTYVRFIPYPVTVGFTAGIAVIIFASQIKDLFGLTLIAPEPAEIIEKAQVLWASAGSFTPAAAAVATGTILVIVGIKKAAPAAPNLLIAVVLAGLSVAVFDLPVETIESKFGELPRLPPVPALPGLGLEAITAALPFALGFALLGAIESLLSAVVADGMSGRRHRSNGELMAQGVANIGSALFGGFCVTGTIARTATNVKAGSRGPVSGMLHALFVLLAMLVAAPLAGHIPLAALAGLLAVVAWNMAEKDELWALIRHSRADAVVVVVTFLLVIFVDLPTGIVVGFALGGLVFVQRMSDAARMKDPPQDEADSDADMLVYRMSGPYFFGAAAQLGAALDEMADHRRLLVIDFADVPFIDSTGARSIALLAKKTARKGGQLCLTSAAPEVCRSLKAAGAQEPEVQFWPDVASVPRPKPPSDS